MRAVVEAAKAWRVADKLVDGTDDTDICNAQVDLANAVDGPKESP